MFCWDERVDLMPKQSVTKIPGIRYRNANKRNGNVHNVATRSRRNKTGLKNASVIDALLARNLVLKGVRALKQTSWRLLLIRYKIRVSLVEAIFPTDANAASGEIRLSDGQPVAVDGVLCLAFVQITC
jgi:hypothetical protein